MPAVSDLTVGQALLVGSIPTVIGALGVLLGAWLNQRSTANQAVQDRAHQAELAAKDRLFEARYRAYQVLLSTFPDILKDVSRLRHPSRSQVLYRSAGGTAGVADMGIEEISGHAQAMIEASDNAFLVCGEELKARLRALSDFAWTPASGTVTTQTLEFALSEHISAIRESARADLGASRLGF